jgi:RNA polymerase sigma factor (sigma-70 family)
VSSTDRAKILFETHREVIKAIVMKQTGGVVPFGDPRFDDCYQDAMLAVYRVLPRADMERNWRGYFKTTARHAALNALITEANQSHAPADDIWDERSGSYNPELAVDEKEFVKRVREGLSADAARLFDLRISPSPELVVATRNLKGTAASITFYDIGKFVRMPRARVTRASGEIKKAIRRARVER